LVDAEDITDAVDTAADDRQIEIRLLGPERHACLHPAPDLI